MKMFWTRSGDWIELNPVHFDLTQYWITELEKHSVNSFSVNSKQFSVLSQQQLFDYLKSVNDFLSRKLKISLLEKYLNQDYLDQQVLNALHSDWIKLLHKFPTITHLLQQNNLGLAWNQINKKIHEIEESFVFSLIGKQYWETSNIFGTSVLSFDHAQVEIVFSQKGRTTFNKWMNFDSNHHDPDTNDFLQIGNEVMINLRRPMRIAPPPDFVAYCHQQKIPVVGCKLPLANFCDFDRNLTAIRHLMVKNFKLDDNTICFEI